MRFAPLTGFFGANSSGKTSILQFLLLLKQTAESLDRTQVLHLGDERSYVNLGSFADIIFNHIEDNLLNFQIEWRPALTHRSSTFVQQWLSSERSVRFHAQFKLIHQVLMLKEFTYREGNRAVGMQLSEIPVDSEAKYTITNDQFLESRNGTPPTVPPPHHFYIFPDALNLYYQDTFWPAWLTTFLDDLLASFEYLGPLRDYPSRTYLLRGNKIGSIGSRGENTIPALIMASADIQDAVARQLKQLGLIHSFALRPVAEGRREYELRIRQTASSPEVLITEVGFGVSQILPVLTLCYYASPNSIIILEQPEIHLHPAVQAGLADVFIDAIKNRGVQIILESHSEHLLRRLQRRLAEEQLSPQDVALYFTSMAQGESNLEELQVDAYGNNINNWPANFFGDEMGDLVAMTEAELVPQPRNFTR